MSTQKIVWNPEQAERLAKFAHFGQVDKAGEDYFQAHIYDAVQILKYGIGGLGSRNERYLALSPKDQAFAEMILWLHDSNEDTKLSVDMLMALGAPSPLWSGVYKLTRPAQRPGWDMLTRTNQEKAKVRYHQEIREDPVLLACKDADIASNTHPRRVFALRKTDPAEADRLDLKYTKDREALGLEDPWAR